MVAFTGGTVLIIATGGVAAAAGAGAAWSAGAGAAAVGTAEAFGVAVGSALSGGAIAGASAASATGASVVVGSGIGLAASGTAVTGTCCAGLGIGQISKSNGESGWRLLLIGTSQNDDYETTYDCWKPVIHDTSEEPSKGMLLKDVLRHPYIAEVSVTGGDVPELPYIVIENIWKEKFVIEYVMIMETREIMGHAKRLAQ